MYQVSKEEVRWKKGRNMKIDSETKRINRDEMKISDIAEIKMYLWFS